MYTLGKSLDEHLIGLLIVVGKLHILDSPGEVATVFVTGTCSVGTGDIRLVEEDAHGAGHPPAFPLVLSEEALLGLMSEGVERAGQSSALSLETVEVVQTFQVCEADHLDLVVVLAWVVVQRVHVDDRVGPARRRDV